MYSGHHTQMKYTERRAVLKLFQKNLTTTKNMGIIVIYVSYKK